MNANPVALVTGANKEIGLQIAKDLATSPIGALAPSNRPLKSRYVSLSSMPMVRRAHSRTKTLRFRGEWRSEGIPNWKDHGCTKMRRCNSPAFDAPSRCRPRMASVSS